MRLALFYLVLLSIQGFLAALLSPLPGPDLFLIAVLTLLWRLPPWQLVAAAYGVGLLQDIVGSGDLGLHAIGLAAAALIASSVRAQLSQSGLFERMLIVLAALAGKWVVTALLLVWLSGSAESLPGTAAVFAVETVFTLVAAALLLPWADALIERTSLLRKELL